MDSNVSVFWLYFLKFLTNILKKLLTFKSNTPHMYQWKWIYVFSQYTQDNRSSDDALEHFDIFLEPQKFMMIKNAQVKNRSYFLPKHRSYHLLQLVRIQCSQFEEKKVLSKSNNYYLGELDLQKSNGYCAGGTTIEWH